MIDRQIVINKLLCNFFSDFKGNAYYETADYYNKIGFKPYPEPIITEKFANDPLALLEKFNEYDKSTRKWGLHQILINNKKKYDLMTDTELMVLVLGQNG